jgi:hypothetical protein
MIYAYVMNSLPKESGLHKRAKWLGVSRRSLIENAIENNPYLIREKRYVKLGYIPMANPKDKLGIEKTKLKLSKIHRRLKSNNLREGSRLELDGYNEKLKIAFEHQGEHHYTTRTHYIKNNEKLAKRKATDKLKRKLCREKDILLLVVPELGTRLKVENLEEFLINEIKKQKTITKIQKSHRLLLL